MAFVTERKNTENDILLLFPIPVYTSSRIYYEEDLEELGLAGVLDGLDQVTREAVFHQAETMARVQPELAFHFLLKYRELLKVIPLEALGQWGGLALDIYDSQGLNPARDFVLQLDKHPQFRLHWGKGTAFHQVYGILQNFVYALGGDSLNIETGDAHYTDTATIYLPEKVALFSDKELNFQLYKVMTTHTFARVALGTYRFRFEDVPGLLEGLTERYNHPPEEGLISPLSGFFHRFPDASFAMDLFGLAETLRIQAWMADALPGLFHRLKKMKHALGRMRGPLNGLPLKSMAMECLVRWVLLGSLPALKGFGRHGIMEESCRQIAKAGEPGMTVGDVAELVAEIYRMMEAIPGPYRPVAAIPYTGELRPEEAERGLRRRREAIRRAFRKELAKLLQELPNCKEVHVELPSKEQPSLREEGPRSHQEVPRSLLVDGNPVPIPEAMQKMVDQIYEDLGALPSAYLAISSEMSGHSFRSLCQMPMGTGYVLSENGEGIHILDEWDYRRQGYRKNWALLKEVDAREGGLDFSDQTLIRYRGMIQRIKRQFERIRMDQTMLRRQKEGDDIDLDAAVEAVSDRMAGLDPSDRLFVRYQRDRRDIAAIFLIDLSGSTSGWINEMERAALLILCEAMKVLRDRFAIYGFSGRTRKRCELYRIKGFDEPYGDRVKRRIAGLRALEYTRMGPPLRYLTTLLKGVEARTRLLISLSDGKPDDYDGYRGDYGIEDTRQALLEAKRGNIHPFCITIDKAEHSYLSHIYGAVNYVFIDNLSKLPVKIPEVYRKLTV